MDESLPTEPALLGQVEDLFNQAVGRIVPNLEEPMSLEETTAVA